MHAVDRLSATGSATRSWVSGRAAELRSLVHQIQSEMSISLMHPGHEV